ncbi:MAG: T9SS type A sorting domain-containing protein [Candidatus Eisenbacteria bacterium]|nr:T9SS type A sorting domain-containing protein [Candidatus Eisenbacteria bacterium]
MPGNERWYLAGFQDPTSVEPEVHVKPVEERMFLTSYPNPFSGTATIEYALPTESHVILRVYDVAGRQIAELVNGKGKAGRNRVDWAGIDKKGANVPSGIYFFELKIGERTFTRKMILTR